MKIIIGKNPHEKFHLIADDGTDVTDKFDVASLEIHINPRDITKATLELTNVEVEVEMDVDNLEIEFKHDFINFIGEES
jgi:hypothetical protein